MVTARKACQGRALSRSRMCHGRLFPIVVTEELPTIRPESVDSLRTKTSPDQRFLVLEKSEAT